MRPQDDSTPDKSDLRRDFQENTSNLNYYMGVWMARGARLKPSFKLSLDAIIR
jgi:hypothetical protein